jgi:hypothetical protein
MDRPERRGIRSALWAALLAAALAAGEAGAGTTYSFAFRPVDVNGDPFFGGNANGTSFSFSSPAAANSCNPVTGAGCPVMDVILQTTDPLIFASISVGYDSGLGGVDIGFITEWDGVGTVFNMAMTATAFFSPINTVNTVDNVLGTFGSFDGAQPPPNGPPSLPAGTYNLGTIVWDTSATGVGFHTIFTFVGTLDATGAVIGGMITDVTGSEVLGVGSINFELIPEPGSAGLLALGLTLLAWARSGRSTKP